MRGLPRWSLALLLVITIAGGALRFDAASDPSAYQSRDEIAYAMIARAIVTNGTYGAYGSNGQDDPIHWPPGAPSLFALAHWIDPEFRGDGKWDVPGAYPWQAAVGTATIVATFVLVALLAAPLAAVLAAAAVAFYPPLISASGDLLSEPLGSLLVTLALAATVLAMRRRTWQTGALAGVLVAGTILTRADLSLLPVLTLGAMAAVGWSRAGDRRRSVSAVRAALPMLAALLVVLTPWTIFASGVAGRFVPLSSGGASNLWVGTYLPGDGSIFGSKRGMEAEVKRLLPQLSDRKPNQISQVHVIRTVAARHPELDQEAALRKEVIFNLREYGLGQPVAFAQMMARKVWRLWGSYTRGTYRKERVWILAIHLTLVGLGIGGVLAGIVLTRRAELWLIGALILYLSLLNAVLVSEARHNLAVMPVVVAGGAIGLSFVARRIRERAARPARPPAHAADGPPTDPAVSAGGQLTR